MLLGILEPSNMANESLASLSATRGYWKGSHYISRGVTGHWSKYGGTIREVVITQFGVVGVEDEWACQSCGLLQPKDLSPYLYKHPDAEAQSERLRVCAVCFNNDCYDLRRRRGEI